MNLSRVNIINFDSPSGFDFVVNWETTQLPQGEVVAIMKEAESDTLSSKESLYMSQVKTIGNKFFNFYVSK